MTTEDRRPSAPNTEKRTSRLSKRKSSIGISQIADIDTLAPLEAAKLAPDSAIYRRPALTTLPTYQLDSLRPFDVHKTKLMVSGLLDDLFADHIYGPESSPALATRIVAVIMRQVKQLNFNRYRILCCCSIGQRRKQCYANAVSFIWDSTRDKYVDFNRETHSAFCQITIFGVYLD